jgi:tryptophan-rich sensory protein
MNEGMLQFACAIVCVALGGLSGYLSNFNDLSWYDGLKQPPFRPPNWLFGIVWTILYTLIGIAFGTLIATSAPSGLIALFVIHFGFNFAWSLIFFKYHFLKYSFIWIAALWAMILLMIYWSTGINCTLFGNVFPVNYLFAPYLCWVYFASVLNGSVYALNGE